ncbi:hypothetical protein FHX72_001408 [Pseudoclavibacter helvolus]|uniref:Uncharacterized protein n=1 Tax=Pseudoclavibacter helvolus TaxID=255205 RepID=A0A7W4UMT5_9MICO|nr:hypothetical protein [Pseudoclavibacter helvolus]
MSPLSSHALIACVALVIILGVYLVYGAPSRPDR